VPQNVNPTFVKTPNNGLILISSGSSNAQVTIYTGGVSGSKIIGLIATCSTNTSAAVDVNWGITNGGTFFPLGTGSAPIGAGYLGTIPAVNMMNTANIPGLPLDSNGNPYVLLKSTADTLVVKQASTVITSGQINLTAISGDF